MRLLISSFPTLITMNCYRTLLCSELLKGRVCVYCSIMQAIAFSQLRLHGETPQFKVNKI